MDDIRDRLARAEQDIKNAKENFNTFKTDDFGSLKREVHSMRGELNEKIDTMLEKLNALNEAMQEKTTAINLTLAKWLGAGGVLIFIGQFLLDKFVK